MSKMMLTNKSSREYMTSKGKFRQGSSKEFEVKEAIRLLGYTGEIVRTEDAIGNKNYKKSLTDKQKEIEKKEKEIAKLKAKINKLEK